MKSELSVRQLTRAIIDAEEGNIEFAVEVSEEDDAHDEASESLEAQRAAVPEQLISLITSPFPRSHLMLALALTLKHV